MCKYLRRRRPYLHMHRRYIHINMHTYLHIYTCLHKILNGLLRVNTPTLSDFCFSMIGGADIEGSTSNALTPARCIYACAAQRPHSRTMHIYTCLHRILNSLLRVNNPTLSDFFVSMISLYLYLVI